MKKRNNIKDLVLLISVFVFFSCEANIDLPPKEIESDIFVASEFAYDLESLARGFEIDEGLKFLRAYDFVVSPSGNSVYLPVIFERKEPALTRVLLLQFSKRGHWTPLLTDVFQSTIVPAENDYDILLNISRDGKTVYLANNSFIDVFNRNVTTGSLNLIENIKLHVGQMPIVKFMEMYIDVDDSHLYGLGLVNENEAWVVKWLKFDRNTSNGRLGNLTALHSFNTYDSDSFARFRVGGENISVFVEDYNNGSQTRVYTLEKNSTTGVFDVLKEDNYMLVHHRSLYSNRYRMVLSPDGKFLYAISNGYTLSLYKKDSQTGRFVFVKNFNNEFLYNKKKSSMTLSSDGKYIYMVLIELGLIRRETSFIIFNRNSENGDLEIYKSISNINSEFPNFNRNDVLSMRVGPDAKNIYVSELFKQQFVHVYVK